MKRFFKMLMFLSVSTITFHACSNGPESDIPSDGNMIKLTISTAKPEAVNTRTMVADDGMTPMWCPGDAIGVSVFSNDSYTNHKFVNDNNETASVKTTFTGSTAVGDVVYTYYPYTSAGVTAQGEARLTIPAVQYPSPTSFDGAADLLVGKPAAITPSTTMIEGLQFKRVGGFLKIVLKDGTGGTLANQKIGSLSITAESHLAGSVYLDIVDGELGGIYADESATVTANYTAQTEYAVGDTGAAAYLGVYPQTLAAGTTLAIAATTQNCDIEKVVELAESIEIKEGQITAITVNIGNENLSEKKIDIEETFPDPVFHDYVLNHIDTDRDGKLSQAEILAVTSVSFNNRYVGIKTLEGIQYFTNLTYLNCSYHNLTSLDLSKNTALTQLDCSHNQLTSLEVSKSTALTDLSCYSNQLTSLDVSKSTALTELNCSNNQLTSLDVSKNMALTELNCSHNQLTSLEVSKNTALTELNCSYNPLTSLDVSKNTALTRLDRSQNQLTSLDVSKNTALTRLYCYGNQLTSLDVSKNTALTELNCAGNQLQYLDFSSNTALTELNCSYNKLGRLVVSQNTSLTKLYCGMNLQLSSLDVCSNTALTRLDCNDNKLTSLDVSKNTALTRLDCSHNRLTSLDASKNTALTELNCSYNQIEELDLSKTDLVNSFYNQWGFSVCPLDCSSMETLKIVYLKRGWSIIGITEDNGRSDSYIPAATKIVFLSGDYGDNGSAGSGFAGGNYEL